MIDYSKLSQVTDSKRHETEKKPGASRVIDSKKGLSDIQKKKIKDAIAKRKLGRASAPKYARIKVKDSYKNLLKKIKDELEETESTDAAIECALSNITPDTPAEDVLAAVMETLGETIDELSAQSGDED